MKINISDEDYYEILVEVGYPIVQERDLEYTREQIEEFFIFPSMREYFSWFPKVEHQTAYVSSSFSFDFPDDFTYGILDARINPNNLGGNKTGSPFMNSLLFNQSNSFSSSRMYGTENDYGVSEARFLEKSYRDSLTSYVKAQRLDIDRENKKLTGYSTVRGEINIQWAKYSINFDDISFKRKTEVINLAKSKVLTGFAMLRGQYDSDTGNSFNVSDFLSRANDLEEKTMEKWKAISKVAIVRN